MYQSNSLAASHTSTGSVARPTSPRTVKTELLTDKHQREVLDFLSERPLLTVAMSSFIRDNGLSSTLNRGHFYACRDHQGQLEGVALIGHATLIEARTLGALEAFARLAQNCSRAHMIMGEQEMIERFWSYYADGGQHPRLVASELLFEQRWPVSVREQVRGLRPATLDDLALVMPVHAQMAEEESGINPLQSDPVGFRLRCSRRIEQGRVWVWIENNQLLFKADIIAETSETVYLEGIYVAPTERGKGYGTRCLSQLGRQLLARAKSICLLVDERNKKAHTFYQRSGFKQRGHFDTIFLQKN
jgi:predicted GNAT family acetyltransferase